MFVYSVAFGSPVESLIRDTLALFPGFGLTGFAHKSTSTRIFQHLANNFILAKPELILISGEAVQSHSDDASMPTLTEILFTVTSMTKLNLAC